MVCLTAGTTGIMFFDKEVHNNLQKFQDVLEFLFPLIKKKPASHQFQRVEQTKTHCTEPMKLCPQITSPINTKRITFQRAPVSVDYEFVDKSASKSHCICADE